MKLWRRKKAEKSPRSASAPRVVENYLPPEGVPIGLEIASLGARFGAIFLDLILTWLTILAIILLVAWTGALPESALWTLVIILMFFAGIPYYVLSELIWHGRTLGKRIVGIRVVSVDGRTLSPHQVVARNLLKQVEFFAPVSLLFQIDSLSGVMVILVLCWTVFVGAFPMLNKRKQRLGDVVAGTLVVVRPKAVLLQDLALSAPVSAFTFDQAQLDVYGKYELQTLEAILRSDTRTPGSAEEIRKVAQTIARRIGYTDLTLGSDPRGFLMAFYREQRERLESRQLFGDRREDKFHGQEDKAG
ncbi:MAG: RDD family protein [Paracoccaceae bacterium]